MKASIKHVIAVPYDNAGPDTVSVWVEDGCLEMDLVADGADEKFKLTLDKRGLDFLRRVLRSAAPHVTREDD